MSQIKELLDEISWEAVLREKGAEKSCPLFRDTLLKAQELSIPQHKKLSTGGRKPAWLNKDLLVKLKDKKEKYRQWKQG